MNEVVSRVVHGNVLVVSVNRPHAKNAVNGATAKLLYDAFVAFDKNESLCVAVLTGLGGTFCAGADLTAMSNPLLPMDDEWTIGPMGPSRLA
jgi:enoyl-CoA hydratase